MNVYIDELASTMQASGVDVVVFTRRTDPKQPSEVVAAGGYREVHVDAGPAEVLPVSSLPIWVAPYAQKVIAWMQQNEPFDVVHSHYWLSGWAGLMVKHTLGIPLANSFHTLGRVKDETRRDDEPPASLIRIAAEQEVITLSDCVIASTEREAEELLDHYGADPSRLCLNPPGVDHGLFVPGSAAVARAELEIEDEPVILFVGRIQPLKGLDVALSAFQRLAKEHENAIMLVVGGPSGPQGESEFLRMRDWVDAMDLSARVRFCEAQDHRRLPTFYRAADLILVPSRSESFGLVAAEAQACGLPVVAARVGGLAYVVADGVSGRLVDGWDPEDHAAAALEILDDPDLAVRLSRGAIEHAERFSWDATATRLLELYAGIAANNTEFVGA
jgi:D-inositol-3-phosphate glycosyltransferase